jgi:hypothetical protein
MDPRAGLEDLEKRKIFTLPGLELQPVASRYTDYTIPVPGMSLVCSSVILCVNYLLYVPSTQFQYKFNKSILFSLQHISAIFTFTLLFSAIFPYTGQCLHFKGESHMCYLQHKCRLHFICKLVYYS